MRNKVVSSLAGAVFSFALSGLAFAADMPVKAPPPPQPAPAYNWTGWYVGGNAGYSFGNVKNDFNAPDTLRAVVGFFGIGVGIGTSNFGSAGSNTEHLDGFIGGGQIGHNWQVSPLWVVGFEVDFQGADEKDSKTLTSNFSGVVNSSVGNIFTSSPVVGSTTLDYRSKIDWFYTIRGRIGYVWGNGDLLTYVTGGVAIGEVHSEVTHAFSGTLTGGGLPLPFAIPATSAISDHDNVGWVVGFGTEGRWAWTNWTWKIEGLYVDLGTLDTTVPAGRSLNSAFISGFGNPFADIVATAGPVTTHTHFTDGIVRVGLNYQFH